MVFLRQSKDLVPFSQLCDPKNLSHLEMTLSSPVSLWKEMLWKDPPVGLWGCTSPWGIRFGEQAHQMYTSYLCCCLQMVVCLHRLNILLWKPHKLFCQCIVGLWLTSFICTEDIYLVDSATQNNSCFRWYLSFVTQTAVFSSLFAWWYSLLVNRSW